MVTVTLITFLSDMMGKPMFIWHRASTGMLLEKLAVFVLLTLAFALEAIWPIYLAIAYQALKVTNLQ